MLIQMHRCSTKYIYTNSSFLSLSHTHILTQTRTQNARPKNWQGIQEQGFLSIAVWLLSASKHAAHPSPVCIVKNARLSRRANAPPPPPASAHARLLCRSMRSPCVLLCSPCVLLCSPCVLRQASRSAYFSAASRSLEDLGAFTPVKSMASREGPVLAAPPLEEGPVHLCAHAHVCVCVACMRKCAQVCCVHAQVCTGVCVLCTSASVHRCVSCASASVHMCGCVCCVQAQVCKCVL